MARCISWSIAVVAVAGVLLSVAAGAFLCDGALRPPRRFPPRQPFGLPAGTVWREVQITARDGAVQRGWLLKPQDSNGSAVIVLHGIADSRAGELGLARMLLASGYAVLTPDLRGQGESGGDLVTYGVLESDDLRRWVTWLVGEVRPRHLFGLGESLGGAVLLQEMASDRRFDAAVAECSFADFEWIADDRVAQRVPRVVAVPAVWMGLKYARWRYGLDLRAASPESAMQKITVPVLLIHGTADDRTSPAHSQALAAKNPKWVRLWLVPGAGHTGAFGAAPADFPKRVLDWFADYQNFPPGIQPREK